MLAFVRNVDRNVGRVVAARLVSRVGADAAFFVGIWGKATFEFDASPAQLAALMAALGISSMAGSAMAGWAVDRTDPKRVLTLAEVAFVPATLAVPFAPSLVWLVGLVAVVGLVGAPVFTAISSFAPYLTTDDERLVQINAYLETAAMAALAVGPAVGALLAGWLSVDAIFVFDAITSLVAVGLVLPVTLRPVARSGPAGFWGELRAGFRVCYSRRSLRFALLAGTAVWFVYGAFGALEPLFYREVLGTGPETLGWVLTIFGVGLIAGSAATPRLPPRLVSAGGLAAMVILNGLGAMLYIGTADLRVVVGGSFVWGITVGVFSPVLRTLIHLDSPDELIGRITGTMQVHQRGGQLIPLAFVPPLAAAFGVQAVLVGSAAVLVALGLLGLPEGVLIDRRRPRRAAPITAPVAADERRAPSP